MTLRKVLAGEQFVAPAATWNAFIDAAQDYKDRTADIGRQATSAGFRSSGIIIVKNESGSARRQFDVLGLGEPIFLPSSGSSSGGSTGGADQSFRNMVTFRGLMPSEDEHVGKFVVLIEPLAANAVGRACVSGVCQVRVNVTDEDHEFAEMADGKADVLESGDTGSAKILWKEDGTGQKWAVVHLGAAASVVAIYARVLSGGSGGDGTYTSWREVELVNGSWTNKQGGLAGPGDGTLREINAAKNVANNTVVHAFRYIGSTSQSSTDEWLFQSPQPFAIFGRITSSSQVSGYGGNRYTYQFAQVEKTGAGYGGWTNVQNGISGAAYNLIEDQNFTSGTLGNGVSISNLTTDKARFTLQPAPTGTRVMLMPVVTTSGSTEYWFSYENGVDGGCI